MVSISYAILILPSNDGPLSIIAQWPIKSRFVIWRRESGGGKGFFLLKFLPSGRNFLLNGIGFSTYPFQVTNPLHDSKGLYRNTMNISLSQGQKICIEL
ncbi:hypothetical protein XELAEV_18038516mg [Xenopus laevis]|uniref:Uncharacterized protein n=1 Tax=Xenopus laevis TaxID=8355 RepID=A0A974H723_XENLA|nr:hypothetical protein XELAEV_18038516mg [Xenopus laevis]